MALKLSGKSVTSDIKYGRLYNWFAYNHTGITSSNDWRAALGFEDWYVLAKYIDPSSWESNISSQVAGKELKETGTIYWLDGNTGTNSVKFNSRGSGTRSHTDGSFGGLKANGTYWSSSSFDGEDNKSISVTSYSSDSIIVPRSGQGTNTSNKHSGCSIRLVKTSTTLSDGESGIYIGNDGTVYKTICIGTQEWLANDLVETKYRDGSSIPNVTDNTEWTELTTGAYCNYNNDESYVFGKTLNNKLKFGLEKIQVLNFNNDAYVEFPSSPILSGLTDDISFYMYLDTDFYDLKILAYFSDVNNDNSKNIFIAGLYENNLIIQVNTGDVIGNKKINITNFVGKTIFVQVKKNDNTNPSSIDYIKFNGINQTLSNNTEFSFGIFPVSLIGAVYNINSELYVFRLNQGTIWGFTIPGRHNWKGNPNGNQNSAWVDNIGNIDGTVGGVTKTNRTVLGRGKSTLKLGN